ncbi:hypothetical protein ACMBCM_08835, partial [Spiroplasma sp. K1]
IRIFLALTWRGSRCSMVSSWRWIDFIYIYIYIYIYFMFLINIITIYSAIYFVTHHFKFNVLFF